MFRFLDKWRYDWILHVFCISPVITDHLFEMAVMVWRAGAQVVVAQVVVALYPILQQCRLA